MISCQSHLQANPNLQFVRDALNLAIQEAATNVCQNLSPDDNKQNQDAINKSEIKDKKDLKECRLRSGSVPSQKRQKQMDVQSVSTMTGTHPSHKSDKRIEDLDPRSQNMIVQQKPLIQPPAAQKQSPLWKIDKNGYLTSATLDITTIKYYFISVATRLGMVVMRDLQDIITVKVHKIDSFRCLFTMCLPMGGSDRCVYQLQRYRVGEKGSRVKLVLISGVEEKFDVFKKSFYYELWSNGVLNLSNFQALTLLCFANSGMINQIVVEYRQACLQYEIRTLSSEQQLQSWQSNLMKKLKQSQKGLKQKIFPESVCQICSISMTGNTCIHRIQKNNINQLMFQRILLHQVPVCELYLKLQMQANKKFHEKRRIILQKYKVKQVFQYLEIDKKLLGSDWLNVGNYGSHSDNDQINKFSLLDLSENEVLWDKLPYVGAVQILDTLNLFASPLENISIISKFSKRLLECFEQRLGGQNAMMDMDNQLPLTIYCIIISKNTQIKPIISFLRQYFDQEDDFESQNRTLAAIKAAFEYVRLQWIL